ncbi:MAG: hypothetical protein KDD50_03565 [Bdellovibrionales bacterium]|nr:hypothetical protein [Bdellovibrionales bacterium]
MIFQEALSEYRLALRFEKNKYNRTLIYVELTRLYRVMGKMKNARLELKRAFTEINLQWPQNSLFELIKIYLLAKKQDHLNADFKRQSKIDQSIVLADLYEEMGLSAYYLRHKYILLISSLASKDICLKLGPSLPLLNWYGGSSCIFALIGFKTKSQSLIKKTREIANHLNIESCTGKYLIWQALMCDYNSNPVLSAQFFKEALEKYADKLEMFDLRLAVQTLSTNYFSRGHYQEALDVLSYLKHDSFPEAFSLDREERYEKNWCSIGPAICLNYSINVSKMVQNFKSVMSADKDEKWELTLFISHLMIGLRYKKILNHTLEDIIKRFEVLNMKPKDTHSESSIYWVIAGYLKYDIAKEHPHKTKEFKKFLKLINSIPYHPTYRSHYNTLLAGYYFLRKNKSRFYQQYEKALKLSQSIENKWSIFELDKMKEEFDAR